MNLPRLLLLFLFAAPTWFAHAQLAFNMPTLAPAKTNAIAERIKTKAANYNSIGYHFPLGNKDIIVGGVTTVYKKFGTFIGYNVGIQNFLMPTNGTRGEYKYDNVVKNGWPLTGKTEESVAFIFTGGLSVAVTRRMPVYFGAGVTRYRQFFEYLDPNDNNQPKWNVNDNETRLELTYTGGVFIPLFHRVAINIAYNSNPQTVFTGLVIYSATNFEDADEWWWGANKR